MFNRIVCTNLNFFNTNIVLGTSRAHRRRGKRVLYSEDLPQHLLVGYRIRLDPTISRDTFILCGIHSSELVTVLWLDREKAWRNGRVHRNTAPRWDRHWLWSLIVWTTKVSSWAGWNNLTHQSLRVSPSCSFSRLHRLHPARLQPVHIRV